MMMNSILNQDTTKNDQVWKTAHSQDEQFTFKHYGRFGPLPRFEIITEKTREQHKLDLLNKTALSDFVSKYLYLDTIIFIVIITIISQADCVMRVEFYTGIQTQEPKFNVSKDSGLQYRWQINSEFAQLFEGIDTSTQTLNLEHARSFIKMLEMPPVWRPIHVYHINSPDCPKSLGQDDKDQSTATARTNNRKRKGSTEQVLCPKWEAINKYGSHRSLEKNDSAINNSGSSSRAAKDRSASFSTQYSSQEDQNGFSSSDNFETRLKSFSEYASRPETVAARGDDAFKNFGPLVWQALRAKNSTYIYSQTTYIYRSETDLKIEFLGLESDVAEYIHLKTIQQDKSELDKAREIIQRQAKTIQGLKEADLEIQQLWTKRASMLPQTDDT